jgi:hypothetical protein
MRRVDPRSPVRVPLTFTVGDAEWMEDQPQPVPLFHAYHALFSLPDDVEPKAPERAALLHRWAEILSANLQHDERDFTSPIVLLATHARRYGLTREVAQLFDEVDRAMAERRLNASQNERVLRLQRLTDLVRPMIAPRSPVE